MNDNINVKRPSISIVTATCNAANHLPRLIDSLRGQTDKDFEWVVADGASEDGTLDMLKAVTDLNVVISSQADSGIYDALNRAIKASSGAYYLVSGADDILYPDAIVSFRTIATEQQPDIINAKVMADGRPGAARRPWPWLYGGFAYVNSHAVGVLIKKSLHQQFGYYSLSYPLVADQLFLKKAGDAGVKTVSSDFFAGEFGMHGSSGKDVLGVITESFRVQLATGENKLVQTALFLVRLIKNFRKF